MSDLSYTEAQNTWVKIKKLLASSSDETGNQELASLLMSWQVPEIKQFAIRDELVQKIIRHKSHPLRKSFIENNSGLFAQLREVDFSSCNLSNIAFPEDFALPKAISLNLSKSNLNTPPLWLKKCLQLKHLDLSHNRLTDDQSGFDFAFAELRTLNLTNTGITTLPMWLSKCPKLEVIRVSDNQIKNFSEQEMNKLSPSIKTIYFVNNQLTKISTAITKFNQLQQIFLAGNQLNTLPEELLKLSDTLQTLDIQDNPFDYLPHKFKKGFRTVMVIEGNKLLTLTRQRKKQPNPINSFSASYQSSNRASKTTPNLSSSY